MNERIVGVVFSGNPREYYFKSYVDLTVGDTVVVDTRNGFAIATVTTDCIDTNYEVTREVVARVDTSAYNVRRAREARIVELREKMDAKVHKLQEIAVYEMLSKSDPELASMLDEFKGLLG